MGGQKDLRVEEKLEGEETIMTAITASLSATKNIKCVIEVITLINTINIKLRKHNNVVGMTSTICDPVFLCHGVWSIDDKFLGFLVICRCCFHLHCIVTIAKFCQTKAPYILKRVNTLRVIKKIIILVQWVKFSKWYM